MRVFMKIAAGAGISLLAFLAYAVPVSLRAREAAESLADEYYNRYNSGDAAYIHASLFSSGLREKTSLEGITEARARTGRLVSRRPVAFKLLALDGSRLYSRFQAAYEKTSCEDQFYFRKEAGALKLEYFPNSGYPCKGG
ncbi:MAG: hypothetical protein M0025_05265 [Elusimicrobia bacterium]|nr:hypothetical protein [Elusimicrobiota bacterium]